MVAVQLVEEVARQVLLAQLLQLRLLLLPAGAGGIGFASWCSAASGGSVGRR